MSEGIIYLDHAAATPMDRRVLDSMLPYFSDNFYNPSSPYASAIEVRRAYESAKDDIAKNLGVKGDEIVITAGATESINLAFGSVEGPVAIAPIEHHAVINASKAHDVSNITVDERGLVTPAAVKAAINDKTELVSVALANNEIGTIQPLKDIAAVVKEIKINRLKSGSKTPLYFHTDASQGVGQLDVNVTRLGVDMMTLNAGKIYGPKQVGLLWAAPQVKLRPLIVGGGQERGLRSGTENVAGAVGFAKALDMAVEHRVHEAKRLTLLRDALQKKLTDVFPEAVVSGHPKQRLAGHLHISFPGLDAERLIFALETQKVYLATGSACAANKGTRSHVLTAIDMAPELADGSLRITLGHLNDATNIEIAAEIIIEEIKKEYARINKC